MQVFTQSPRMWRPTAHPDARPLSRAPRELGLPVVCHAIYLINLAAPTTSCTRSRSPRSPHAGGRVRDRGRRRSSSTSARTSAPASRRGSSGSCRRCGAARACSGHDVAADGELRGRRRHDRPLDRRARDAPRRARPAPAPRRLPRLVPSLRVRRRRHRPAPRSTRSLARSTRRSGSTGCARCT